MTPAPAPARPALRVPAGYGGTCEIRRTGIVLLGLLGVALSGLFRLVEHRTLAWYRGLRQAERGA